MKWENIALNTLHNEISKRLYTLLDNGNVTWFLSGGSNIALEAASLSLISSHPNIANLTILLIDERFGSVGHKDSNWEQLRQAGFKIEGPTYIDPFTVAEVSIEQAVNRYEHTVADLLKDDSYTFAQLGMGNDGHVSGILPGSSAAKENHNYVEGYTHDPFVRLTTTFKSLKSLDEVALVAYGQDKWRYLENLSQDIDPITQPVQIIKAIPSVTIYTDYKTG